MHLNIDLLQHGLEITSYLGIPKTQYTIALLLQPPLPRAIVPRCLAIAVVSAVDLDDETFCWAEKIDDIGTKRPAAENEYRSAEALSARAKATAHEVSY
jgi:hypothetical protein